MASNAFIKTQLAHARDPMPIPHSAKVSAGDAYSLPPHQWDHNTRAVYEHFQPSIAPRPPLAPLNSITDNDNNQTAASEPLHHIVEDRNPYANQQQQHANVDRMYGNSQPNSASVSTIQHNEASGVNVMPTRAHAVGVATPPPSHYAQKQTQQFISDVTNNHYQSQNINTNAAAMKVSAGAIKPLHHNTTLVNGMSGGAAIAATAAMMNNPTTAQLQHASSSVVSAATSTNSPAANAAVQHLLSQIQFLHKEVERLEEELTSTRHEHAETMRKMFERGMRNGGGGSLNVSGADLSLSAIADGSAGASLAAAAAAAAVLGPAAATRRLHEHQLQIAAGEAQQLSQRCRNLEAQLAASNAAKTVAINEKIELNNKIRKLEQALKAKKQSLNEVEESYTTQNTTATEEAAKLKQRLEATQKEFVRLAKQLDKANEDLQREQREKFESKSRMVSSFVQCGGGGGDDGDILFNLRRTVETAIGTDVPLKLDACCQVDTTMTRLYGDGIDDDSKKSALQTASTGAGDLLFMMGGFGEEKQRAEEEVLRGGLLPAAPSAIGTLNYNNMAHLLQIRCAELDTARGDLHRLSEAQKETLQFLDTTKKRLSGELERRKVLENENEKLALQVRALQQQASLLSSQIREKDTMVENFQKDAQQAITTSLRLEQERSQWEAELSTNAKDMQNMITNHNLVQQQLATINRENEELRAEIQRLLQLEATSQMSYRAKEIELQEVLQAYQMAVREGEANVQKQRAIERETENLRAAVSVKEERIVHLCEQVASLNAREQQLTLDLQSFDYEGGQLHRKLIQSETTIAQLNAEIRDLKQHQLTFQRIQQELDMTQMDLSKKLVLRDQECMHLRMRLDQLEQECTALSTARFAETNRLKELEDLNAKQLVREALYKNAANADAENHLRQAAKEVGDLHVLVREKDVALLNAQKAAEKDRIALEEHVLRMKELEQIARVAEQEKSRLQRLVSEQAEALEKLAQ